MTLITNTEAISVTTMEDIQAWMTSNSIPITGGISLDIDQMGFVKSLDTDVTFTAQQIIDFKQNFFNKKIQGNMGVDIASSSTITLNNGNLFAVTGTTDINYITTTDWKPGSIICLIFDSDITINHNTGSPPANTVPLFLNNEVLFDFKSGSTLTLTYDDNYWREIARMDTDV